MDTLQMEINYMSVFNNTTKSQKYQKKINLYSSINSVAYYRNSDIS